AAIGLWEPGWGVAAAFPLLVAALAAGVLRDPDGPEIHVFLRVALAFTAGFLFVSVALTTTELDRLGARAPDDAVVREQIDAIRAGTWPKWIVIAIALPIGAAALAWRATVLRRARAARANFDADREP
nr:hypothetical protein [Myxococcota bacterium]